jgi:O-antigen/teichoic acid export membrane protein
MIKKLISGSKYYILISFLPVLFSFFTLPLISPYLTLRDYGVYGVFYSIYNFLILILNLGFTIEIQNAYFKNKENYKNSWSEIIGFQFVWNIIASFLLGILLILANYNLFSVNELSIIICLVLIQFSIFEPIRNLTFRHLQYEERHKLYFIYNLISLITQYTVVLYFVIVSRAGFISWFIGSFFSLFVIFLLGLYHLKKHQLSVTFNFSFKSLKNRFLNQVNIIFHNISGYVLDVSDRFLLSYFGVPINEIGIYNLAYNYSNYAQSINNSINSVFSPVYFKALSDKSPINLLNQNKQIKGIFETWFSIIGFIVLLMIAWAEQFFKILYKNEELQSAFIYSFPILISYLYRPFYVMIVDNLIIQEKNKYVFFISFSSAIVNLILNLFFIPIYGIKATIYTTSIAYLMMGFIGFFITSVKKELTSIYFNKPLIVFLILLSFIIGINFLNLSNYMVKYLLTALALLHLIYFNKEYIASRFRHNKSFYG